MIAGLVSGVSCCTMLFDGWGTNFSIAFEGWRGLGGDRFFGMEMRKAIAFKTKNEVC